jgi:hypothetical protein
VLVVNSPDVEAKLGVTAGELLIEPYDRSPIESKSQAIGRLAWAQGYHGLMVPSAADPGFHNIVFLGQPTPGRIHLINPDRLPKRKRTFTRKTSRKGS